MNKRLAPGLVWPLRAQDLASALGKLREQVEVVWVFWSKQPTTEPITASWAPVVNGMADRPEAHHGLRVWIYPVAKHEHTRVREVVQSEVMPDLVGWCRDALAAPEGWTLMRHERRWSLTGDTVRKTDRDGVAALHWSR